MSLKFFDSFGGVDVGLHSDVAGDELKGNWINYSGVTITELLADTNGRRAYATGTMGSNLQPRVALDTDDITIGFRFFLGDAAADRLICAFIGSEGSNGLIGILGYDSADGKLTYTVDFGGDPDANIVLKSDAVIVDNVYTYIEVAIHFDGSAGTVSFSLNGTGSGSISSVDTEANAGPCFNIQFMENRIDGDWDSDDRIADIYIKDDVSGFLGPMEIWYQNCDQAGDDADFTPSAGANHDNVDEYGHDADATHNTSSTSAHKDSLGHSDVLDIAPLAIQALVFARSILPGMATMQVGVKSGATEALSASRRVSEDYDAQRGPIQETNPDGGGAWTVTSVGNAKTVYTKI